MAVGGRKKVWSGGLLVLPVALLVLALFVWPLVELVLRSFEGDEGPLEHYARIVEVPTVNAA